MLCSPHFESAQDRRADETAVAGDENRASCAIASGSRSMDPPTPVAAPRLSEYRQTTGPKKPAGRTKDGPGAEPNGPGRGRESRRRNRSRRAHRHPRRRAHDDTIVRRSSGRSSSVTVTDHRGPPDERRIRHDDVLRGRERAEIVELGTHSGRRRPRARGTPRAEVLRRQATRSRGRRSSRRRSIPWLRRDPRRTPRAGTTVEGRSRATRSRRGGNAPRRLRHRRSGRDPARACRRSACTIFVEHRS